jgi:site-specific recombinase XerD
MQLFWAQEASDIYIALLDEEMRIIRPVFMYLRHLTLKGCSINTLRAYGSDLKLYWEFLRYKGFKYEDVKPLMVSEFLEYLRATVHSENIEYLNTEAARSGRTINRIFGTVFNLYKYIVQFSGIDNPFIMDEAIRPFAMFKGLLHHTRKNSKIRKSVFKVKEFQKPCHILSSTQMDKILAVLTNWRDRIIFKILRDTGIRIGELLSLHTADIPYPDHNEKVGTIRLKDRPANTSDKQLKANSRDVIFPMALIQEIDEFIFEVRSKINTDHDYLFVAQKNPNRGNPFTYSGVQKTFKRASEKSSVPFTLHDLRHTFCTDALEAGKDIAVVQAFAGHKHIATTQKYLHPRKEFVDNEFRDFIEKRDLSNDEGANYENADR